MDSLQLYSSTSYGGSVISANPATTEIGTSTVHGATIQRALVSSSFWRGTITGGNNVGFSDAVWDTGAAVNINGYPSLRGLGGQ